MTSRTRREFLSESALAGGSFASAALVAAAGLDTHAARAEQWRSGEKLAEGTAQEIQNDPGAAQAAWHEFLDVLRESDRSFIDGARGSFDDAEMAYGYRYLGHLTRFVIDLYLYGDPDAPVFLPFQDAPVEKTLGGHPDVHYFFSALRGDRRYRITGKRGDEAYLSFTVHRGDRGSGLQQFFDSHLNHHDIKTDTQGGFELILSPKREGENWLRLSPDANEVYARAYMLDRTHDVPATFRIESLDTPIPRRLGREDAAERLRWATRAFREMSGAFVQPLENPNQIGDLWQIEPTGPSAFWQAVDNVYARGVFSLEPSEALLLEGKVVPCDYWGIQLWSPCGLGSGDFRLGPVSINSSRARLGPDGEFRVVIAREDPGVPGLDWVSTAGERKGTFFIRWLVPRTRPAAPTCRLVTLDELRG